MTPAEQLSEIDRLRAQAHDLTVLCDHLQKSAEHDKSILARKLHDELGGLLTAAKMDLSWLQPRIIEPVLQERLAQLGAVLDEAMNLKRRVVEALRPSLLDHFGLPTAARAYVESTCNDEGLTAIVLTEHNCEQLPREAAIAMFRVVQEGLANTIRHAKAREVRLELGGTGPLCMLTLMDDGCGFDPAGPGFRWGFGISAVRQRMLALGGRFHVESNLGKGTRLTVQVPMLTGAARSGEFIPTG